jgi:CBS domain-containing protein
VSVLARGLSTSTAVAEFMTVSPELCNEDDDTTAVAARMRELSVRRLVVANADRRVVGIVSLVDLPTGKQDREDAR